MTDKEYREFQQKKYYSRHKQYKVYLSVEGEADIIEILDKDRNRSGLIKQALIAYLRGGAA